MKRPTIKSPCVADRYVIGRERIAEFSTPSGKGGLISVRESDDGAATVNVYRCDEGVTVIGPADPVRDAAPDMLAALKALLAYEDDRPAEGTRGAEVYAQAEAAIAKAEGRAND